MELQEIVYYEYTIGLNTPLDSSIEIFWKNTWYRLKKIEQPSTFQEEGTNTKNI